MEGTTDRLPAGHFASSVEFEQVIAASLTLQSLGMRMYASQMLTYAFIWLSHAWIELCRAFRHFFSRTYKFFQWYPYNARGDSMFDGKPDPPVTPTIYCHLPLNHYTVSSNTSVRPRTGCRTGADPIVRGKFGALMSACCVAWIRPVGTDEPDSLLWTRLDNLDFKLLNMDECAAKNARKAGAPLTMMTMLCSLMLQGLHGKVPLLASGAGV